MLFTWLNPTMPSKGPCSTWTGRDIALSAGGDESQLWMRGLWRGGLGGKSRMRAERWGCAPRSFQTASGYRQSPPTSCRPYQGNASRSRTSSVLQGDGSSSPFMAQGHTHSFEAWAAGSSLRHLDNESNSRTESSTESNTLFRGLGRRQLASAPWH
jgi:hypothetical protein